MEISKVIVTLRARELRTGELEDGFVGVGLDVELGADFHENGLGEEKARVTCRGQ